MSHQLISIPSSTDEELEIARDEVSHFTTTDMGIQGAGPWAYRILDQPGLTELLEQTSEPTSSVTTHSVTWQPCSSSYWQSQDRVVVESWTLSTGETWQFNAIFDGHLNSHTVDYVSKTLPAVIHRALDRALRADAGLIDPATISEIFRHSITAFDEAICSDFQRCFPTDGLDKIPDEAIDQVLLENPQISAATCGTTAILSLSDPSQRDVWVACLGDSYAVLGQRTISNAWTGTLVNAIHDGHQALEAERIGREHSMEPEAILNGRILGFLEPTRAFGNAWLKLPIEYSTRIFPRLVSKWISPERFQEYTRRLKTPPYLSSTPDVVYITLPASPSFLILASDGLASIDGSQDMPLDARVNMWAETIGQASDLPESPNLALALLHSAVIGDDTRRGSELMTVEMESQWMDDTSITVQRFPGRES